MIMQRFYLFHDFPNKKNTSTSVLGKSGTIFFTNIAE